MSALFIAISKITDQAKLNEYLAAAGGTMGNHPIELVAFSTDAKTIEGTSPGPRIVVLKFPDQAAAMAWYNSPEYQKVVQLRLDSTEGFAVLCDGV